MALIGSVSPTLKAPLHELMNERGMIAILWNGGGFTATTEGVLFGSDRLGLNMIPGNQIVRASHK